MSATHLHTNHITSSSQTDPRASSTGQKIRFAIAIIISLGAIATCAVGAYGYFSSLGNLSQVHALIMMASGGALCLFTTGLIAYVKWSQKKISEDNVSFSNNVTIPIYHGSGINNKESKALKFIEAIADEYSINVNPTPVTANELGGKDQPKDFKFQCGILLKMDSVGRPETTQAFKALKDKQCAYVLIIEKPEATNIEEYLKSMREVKYDPFLVLKYNAKEQKCTFVDAENHGKKKLVDFFKRYNSLRNATENGNCLAYLF